MKIRSFWESKTVTERKINLENWEQISDKLADEGRPYIAISGKLVGIVAAADTVKDQ